MIDPGRLLDEHAHLADATHRRIAHARTIAARWTPAPCPPRSTASRHPVTPRPGDGTTRLWAVAAGLTPAALLALAIWKGTL